MCEDNRSMDEIVTTKLLPAIITFFIGFVFVGFYLLPATDEKARREVMNKAIKLGVAEWRINEDGEIEAYFKKD